MPRTWLQIGRKEDIPIIIQACEKIKQMYHNGLRYGRIAALVLFTHIVMLLAVLFRVSRNMI